MSTLELKEAIHHKIDVLENIGELTDINQSLDWFFTHQLSKEEDIVLKRLENINNVIENGQGLKHETVQEAMKQWIRR